MGSDSLSGKTLFITGASRGIGEAIALRAARDGANVVVAAKTAEAHDRLPGTIYSTARAIEAAGGAALPVRVDVRDEAQIHAAVEQAVGRFGGIDILVNNASAISLTRTEETPLKRYDLMMDVNVRGTFACTQACLPYLRKAANPHVLTLSPPLDLEPRWFGPHVAYTTSKFAMSMLVLGLAEELRPEGIAVNALWPRTLIATSALKIAAPDAPERSRTPEIMADAAHRILTRDSRAYTGRFSVDEQVLRAAGVTDFTRYAVQPGVVPELDLFVT
jgi:citronellol/citronellal dehydrogenase